MSSLSSVGTDCLPAIQVGQRKYSFSQSTSVSGETGRAVGGVVWLPCDRFSTHCIVCTPDRFEEVTPTTL